MHVHFSLFPIRCNRLRLPVLCLVSFIVLFLTGCSKRLQPVSATGFYYDTVITITLYAPDSKPLLD